MTAAVGAPVSARAATGVMLVVLVRSRVEKVCSVSRRDPTASSAIASGDSGTPGILVPIVKVDNIFDSTRGSVGGAGETSGAAIITGAASGFGEAMARRFAEEGCKIVVADLNAKAAERVASELGEAAVAVTTDVSRKSEFDEMLVKIRVTQRGWSHIHAAAVRAQIHRDTQNGDFRHDVLKV